MSTRACAYVKTLTTASNGKKISRQEKAILWYLADCHNEKDNAAWPSVRVIAMANNLSERRVREITAGLEACGVIKRTQRLRPNGSVTSNYYSFPTLASTEPVLEMSTNRHKAKPKPSQEDPAKFRRVGGDISQERDAETRREPCEPSPIQNYQSALTGELSELQREPLPPTPLQGGEKVSWGRVLVELKTELYTTSLRTNLPNEYEDLFRDTWQSGSGEGVICIESKNPAKTRIALKKYQRILKRICLRLFGSEVRLEAVELEERDSLQREMIGGSK